MNEHERHPVIFERCQFEGDSLTLIGGYADVRFINCHFVEGIKLSDRITRYVTENKDTDSIEGGYQLFKILVASSDYSMIQYLQEKLIRLLTKRQLKEVDPEQDRMYREIFCYQTTD